MDDKKSNGKRNADEPASPGNPKKKRKLNKDQELQEDEKDFMKRLETAEHLGWTIKEKKGDEYEILATAICVFPANKKATPRLLANLTENCLNSISESNDSITLYYDTVEDRENGFEVLEKSKKVAAVFPYEISGFSDYEKESDEENQQSKTYVVPKRLVDLLLESKFAKIHPDYEESSELTSEVSSELSEKKPAGVKKKGKKKTVGRKKKAVGRKKVGKKKTTKKKVVGKKAAAKAKQGKTKKKKEDEEMKEDANKEEEAEKDKEKESGKEKENDKGKEAEKDKETEKDKDAEKEVEKDNQSEKDAEKDAEPEKEAEVNEPEKEPEKKGEMDEDPKEKEKDDAAKESTEPEDKEKDSSELESLRKSVEQLRSELEAKEAEHKKAMSEKEKESVSMQTEMEVESKKLESEKEEALKKQEEEFTKKQEEFKKKLKKIESDHKKAMEKAQVVHVKEMKKAKKEMEKADADQAKKMAGLQSSLEKMENNKFSTYEPELLDSSGMLPMVWPDIAALETKKLKSLIQERGLDWEPSRSHPEENVRKFSHYLDSQALKPRFENIIGIRVNSVGGKLPDKSAQCLLAIAGRYLVLEKRQSYQFVVQSELSSVQFHVLHDGSRWTASVHLKKGRIDIELPLVDARNQTSDFTLNVDMFIEQKLHLPGTEKILKLVKNSMPNSLVDRHKSTGVKIRTISRRYFYEMRGYDYLLFGCATMAEYLSHFPQIELSSTHAKIKMTPEEQESLRKELEEIEKRKPKMPKILPPQMKIPQDKSKGSKFAYMKNQVGVPKDWVRVGNMVVVLKFINNCWSETYQKEIFAFLSDHAHFKNTFMTFHEGDKVMVTLKKQSKKGEYNNAVGVISGPVKDSRYPITINQKGNTKTLKVRPPCLSLVETKTQTVRVNVICGNCYQAQVVVKKVNSHFAFGGKVIADFHNFVNKADQRAEAKYQTTGMMLMPPKNYKNPTFVDESPIFGGVGAYVKVGHYSEMCIGSNRKYFFLHSGRFVKRSDENKSWNWHLLQTPQIETFLKDLGLYKDYYENLKEYSLPELASLCFTPHFRGDWYALVKSESHRSKIRKHLEKLRPNSRHHSSYRDLLKSANRNAPIHKLPKEDWSLINLMACSLKVRTSELRKTLQNSYGIEFTVLDSPKLMRDDNL